jgi:hypothetical protein
LYVLSLETRKDMKLSFQGDSAPHWIKN